MTLLEVIHRLEESATHQPSIKMIVRNDAFRLNGYPNAKYGVFAYVQGNHSVSIDSDLATYSFTLFYIDRKTGTGDNENEVKSVGISTITNVLERLYGQGIESASQVTFTPFTQRFVDDCTGVFARVDLVVPRSYVCEENYPDFNEDYNNDFLII